MVLFTSYEMMRRCADILRDDFESAGLTLLVQGESGSRNRMTRVFRQDGGSVLFGTQSFWEGVDVMGEALSCVVVAKLPFASPGDPIVSARCERIDEAGGHSFFEYSVPLAVLKLRQGFGRLIRHRNDRGSVIVADSRIVTKPYGRAFLSSLPAQARRCRSISELEASLVI
jgi:ATP-dependent DNA helicase DinG